MTDEQRRELKPNPNCPMRATYCDKIIQEAIAQKAPAEIRRILGVYSGRPLISGVPVNVLQNRYRAGNTAEFLAEDFEIRVCDVLAALAVSNPDEPVPLRKQEEL